MVETGIWFYFDVQLFSLSMCVATVVALTVKLIKFAACMYALTNTSHT